MNKSRKKKILLFLLTLLSFYVLWLSYHLLNFRTYKVPPELHSPLEIEGTYHIHTVFSDGHKHPDKIANLAEKTSLDFIVLVDHGNPNHEILAHQGWKQGVLVLAGTELSVSRGHLVALDLENPPQKFAQNTEQAVHQITTSGGFSIIAHPYSKTRWSWGRFIEYSGIEIINADTMLKKSVYSLLPYLPTLLIKPELMLLKMLNRPEENLRKWDELNKVHPIYGYFSADAHLLYRPLLSSFRLHLSLKRPLSKDFETAKRQVYNALRQGRFYSAIEAAAQAKGFQFWGEKKRKKISMGNTALLDSPISLHIENPFPFASQVHLIHNGIKIFDSNENSVSFEAKQPGVYRIEIYLRERTPLEKNIPWIVSNPIFLQER